MIDHVIYGIELEKDEDTVRPYVYGCTWYSSRCTAGTGTALRAATLYETYAPRLATLKL